MKTKWCSGTAPSTRADSSRCATTRAPRRRRPGASNPRAQPGVDPPALPCGPSSRRLATSHPSARRLSRCGSTVLRGPAPPSVTTWNATYPTSRCAASASCRRRPSRPRSACCCCASTSPRSQRPPPRPRSTCLAMWPSPAAISSTPSFRCSRSPTREKRLFRTACRSRPSG